MKQSVSRCKRVATLTRYAALTSVLRLLRNPFLLCQPIVLIPPLADAKRKSLKYNFFMDFAFGVSTNTYTYAGTGYANPDAPT